LDNLGRVYARSGQFPQAIQVWERKIPLATSALEKAWLFHEIGQCHFGLGLLREKKLSLIISFVFFLKVIMKYKKIMVNDHLLKLLKLMIQYGN
jgi:hypothetical protein